MKVKIKASQKWPWIKKDKKFSKEIIFEYSPNDEYNELHNLVAMTTQLASEMFYHGLKKFTIERIDEVQEGE